MFNAGHQGQRPGHFDDVESRRKEGPAGSHNPFRFGQEQIKPLTRNTLSIDEKAGDSIEIPTFFSKMKPRFKDIKLESGGGIPVNPFLQACKQVVSIFDKLNSAAFSPVKMDLNGNIRKISLQYDLNPSAKTLQELVLKEKNAGETQLPDSVTQALLWMKRSVHFIQEFIYRLSTGSSELSDVSEAATKAYELSLKPYHGWVVRGMFSVGLSAVGSDGSTLAKAFAESEVDFENPKFINQLKKDLRETSQDLKYMITEVDRFYEREGIPLDS
ncbi:pleckstrin homology domain-containing family A member 8 isoform X2 [Lingula anatina]|uniref:Pleckstrin homology domain-containing family A member 8 isoform X2 n=1 Tax=Lingula anatina TaxID=7574 RepID=A0A1S3HVS5_LINAN|nr:pleckstrin homology domain-containing family A member 8 isoform X3 [Lingula anatina]XP_013389652.1 pleckstrin homology domain-containing family A member 8 isoform X2 [Lingula anatina]|eukprot:XP_013389651.1 pleckstrin homology domain-containing family A member 8 isoform X3 [Lingula anatina]